MKSRTKTSAKVRSSKSDDKAAVLSAWHRVDCKTREAMRRTSFLDLIERIEVSHYKTKISFLSYHTSKNSVHSLLSHA